MCNQLTQVTKEQIEEKLSAVAVLRNSAGIDRTVIQDVESTLSTVMKLCGAREHKLQQALQLVFLDTHYRLVIQNTCLISFAACVVTYDIVFSAHAGIESHMLEEKRKESSRTLDTCWGKWEKEMMQDTTSGQRRRERSRTCWEDNITEWTDLTETSYCNQLKTKNG